MYVSIKPLDVLGEIYRTRLWRSQSCRRKNEAPIDDGDNVGIAGVQTFSDGPLHPYLT